MTGVVSGEYCYTMFLMQTAHHHPATRLTCQCSSVFLCWGPSERATVCRGWQSSSARWVRFHPCCSGCGTALCWSLSPTDWAGRPGRTGLACSPSTNVLLGPPGTTITTDNWQQSQYPPAPLTSSHSHLIKSHNNHQTIPPSSLPTTKKCSNSS